MENFKLEIFESENNGSRLEFEKVEASEFKIVSEKILVLLKRKAFEEFGKFFIEVDNNLDQSLNFENLDDLNGIINLIDNTISGEQDCYIIWNYPSQIDKVQLNYLIDNWLSFWYPESDEAIVLLLPDSDLIILLTDYGLVKFTKLTLSE